LEGPKSVLHTMPDSILISITGKQVNQNFNNEVELLDNTENIKRDPPLVKVMFEVGSVIVVKNRLKLTPLNASQKKLFPDSVSAWFKIPNKRAEEFKLLSNEMSAKINMKNVVGDLVIPNILKAPPYAELVKIDTLKAN
jgi:hypothetical protein